MLAQIIDFAEYKARRVQVAADDDRPTPPAAPAAVVIPFPTALAA